MIPKKKIFQIVVIVLIVMLVYSNITNLTPETKNYKIYSEALAEYNDNDFSNSYYMFGKISNASKLKPAAIYRQAVCANKLGDYKSEFKKYKDLTKHYSNSVIGLKAQYLKAQFLYDSKDFKKAKREFKNIVTWNPNSNYAIAAQYYLGSIEAEKAERTKNPRKKIRFQNKAISYFKTYLKKAPNGRFAISSIQKWSSFNRQLPNEDNLLIAKVYQANKKYQEAAKYLNLTNFSMAWPYIVKNAYELKNYDKVKYYTVQGLKTKDSYEVLINEDLDEKAENQSIYEAIDDYLLTSNDEKTSISYLLSISKESKGYDYLLYKTCKNLPAQSQTACYNTLFYEYPDGQFAADALANIFYDKVKTEKYFMAQKLGKTHLIKYPNSNSTPMVIFWLAKTAERSKKYEEAISYYKNLLATYPDDYYAYRAFLNLNRFRRFNINNLEIKPIEFPYKNSNYGIITELAKVKDYGLINQLCQDDEFIQSWLAYLQGDFAVSARIARDAIAKMPRKPGVNNPMWRLAYPIHYYNEIKQSADSWNNDPIIILSIIREESYFNPKAKSAAGARGLMQLMSSTALDASSISGISLPNVNLLYDPYINIRLGNVYYANLRRNFKYNDTLAILAYNGGLGSVSKWQNNINYFDTDDFVEQIPYQETQNYLKKVYRSYWNYIRIYNGIH